MAVELGRYAQQVQNGQLVDTSASATSLSSEKVTSGDNTKMDQMDFINLLVAEMQNQDPLEPSSNTDYVAQMATFSQVQSLDDMKTSMANMTADNLVGKYVTIQVTARNGDVSEITGNVDYVKHEGDKTYVSVEDQLYNAEDVVTVMDERYSEANVMAETFKSLVNQLPSLMNLTESDALNVAKTRYVYDSMDIYTKQFVDSSLKERLEKLEEVCRQYGWGEYAAGKTYGPAAVSDSESEDTTNQTITV